MPFHWNHKNSSHRAMDGTASQSLVDNKMPQLETSSIVPDHRELVRHYSNSLAQTAKEIEALEQPRVSSILKTSHSMVDSETRPRKDSNGVIILSGSKKHHIRFKPKITEVKEVESFKKYNLQESEECRLCTIF